MDFSFFFPKGTMICALPNWKNPRLLMPAQTFWQRWHNSELYPAFRTSARVYRLFLRCKAACNVVKLDQMDNDSWILGDFILNLFPQAVYGVVLIGTTGPAQKITIQFRDKNYQPVGYLKHAIKKNAQRNLQREYQILQSLPIGIGPKAIKFGRIGEGLALLLEPVPGKQLTNNLPPTAKITGFLRKLTIRQRIEIQQHPWIISLQRRSEINLEQWLLPLSSKKWPVVIQHGDFAPWNILQQKDGRLSAIDWEYGKLEGFPGLDLAFYFLQVSALIKRWSPQRAINTFLDYCVLKSPYALTTEQIIALLRLTSYDAYLNSLEDGHSPQSPLQQWRREIQELTWP